MSNSIENNLAVARRYVELYNTDPERFVRECYHEDYYLECMGLGSFQGIEKFVEVEKTIWNAAPQRRMKVKHLHATEHAVTVEVLLVDESRGKDWNIPLCAVLEIRGDKIAVDRSYADFKKWPGLDLA